MQQVSWWQAWELWWSGKPLDGCTLWGLPMLWWGRIGKVAQFSGGLVAILDIVGPERIQAWGQRIRDRRKGPRSLAFEAAVKRSTHIYGEVFGDLLDSGQRFANSRPGSPGYGRRVSKRDLSSEAIRVRAVVRVTSVLVVIACWAWAIWHDTTNTEQQSNLAWWWTPLLVVGAAVALMLAPLVLIAVFTAVGLLVNLVARFWPVAFYYLVVRPPLALLRGPQPDRSLRVAGVLLVVAGFSFDLLAT